MNEILVLNETEFREIPFDCLKSPVRGPYTDGLHSLCPGDNFCILDAKRFTGLKQLLGPLQISYRQAKDRRGGKT